MPWALAQPLATPEEAALPLGARAAERVPLPAQPTADDPGGARPGPRPDRARREGVGAEAPLQSGAPDHVGPDPPRVRLRPARERGGRGQVARRQELALLGAERLGRPQAGGEEGR